MSSIICVFQKKKKSFANAGNFNQTGIAFLIRTLFSQLGNVRKNVVSLFLVISWYSKEIFKQLRASLENAMKRSPRSFFFFCFSYVASCECTKRKANVTLRNASYPLLPLPFASWESLCKKRNIGFIAWKAERAEAQSLHAHRLNAKAFNFLPVTRQRGSASF